ncbi:MAG: group 1 truncated hemoglobin [Phenylobacterium sp.]|uniref:group I truncated hemoglobin n=1 Tax=Phenylobacterium sp. TaxID=1871053 RepID=UPI0025FECAE5|nr:group 1 truncated hemoglobin [Phenylobacterium sp.]MBI1196607.1 group 1 truncated hemoglobin [Phenylobacterium sp.]
MTTLYERIGGTAAVKAAVDIFYGKVLADARIAHFFEGVDMTAQNAKQRAFLIMAFGGPNTYSGADMRRGHAHLVARGLNDSHFDAVVENLAATLTELGVGQAEIAEVAAVAESVRDDVLGRSSAEAA